MKTRLPDGWHSVTPRIVTDDVGGLVEFVHSTRRRGMVEDRWGNIWQIAASNPLREALTRKGCRVAAIDW